MITFANRRTLSLATISIVFILSGCASPANRAAMTPQVDVANKNNPFSLHAQTRGGSETGAADSSNISDADLKAAIENAVIQSKVFKRIVQGTDGDYELSVSVVTLTKPLFGGTFTVELETAWSLTKAGDRSVVMRKSIKTSGTATMGDALVAVTRLRMAVENAARESIRQGVKAISEIDIK